LLDPIIELPLIPPTFDFQKPFVGKPLNHSTQPLQSKAFEYFLLKLKMSGLQRPDQVKVCRENPGKTANKGTYD
jgi:hypothetical protein